MKSAWSSLEACRAQGGAVLPLTLIILLVLAALVTALLATGVMEPQIAANVLRGNQALSLAEAGAERTIAFYSDIANQGDINSACDPTCGAGGTLFGGAQNLGNLGTYAVTWRPISFATILVESTGTTTIGNTQRAVRVVLTKQYVARYAVLGDRGIKVKKDSHVRGNFGAVHDNTRVHIHHSESEELSVEKTATSAGAKESTCKGCTDPERVGIPELSGSGRPHEEIPPFSPLDFKAKADYILDDDGFVRDKSGKVLNEEVDAKGKTTGKPTVWNGWEMGGKGEWVNTLSSGKPPDGTYYASKRIRIKGAAGSLDTPWKATLISGDTKQKGTVDIRSDAVMEPATNELPLIVAGTVRVKWHTEAENESVADIAADPDAQAIENEDTATDDANDKKDKDDEKVQNDDPVGPGFVSLKGVIIATSHKQPDKGKGRVKLSGDVRLTGNIIARGRVELHKGATVTYNVGTRTRTLGPLRVLSWSTTQH